MARMIPDACSTDAPLSERRIFEILKAEPTTRAWTVFHSQGLSSAYTGHFGEVDFLALVPGLGLLCIEVKGGGIRCKDGEWSSTDRHGKTFALKRSPFLQAQQAMHKVRTALEARFGRNSAEASCPLGWMVVFTDTFAPPASTDFVRGELLDCNELEPGVGTRLAASPSLVRAVAQQGAPTPSVLDAIRKFLRPDFDRVETLATTLWDAERRLLALTDEQYDVLDHVLDNETAVIHGGAGTGKTVLAVELARRLAARGRSVLLTCFNRELGLWLESRAEAFGPGRVVAGNLHRLLRPAVQASGLATGEGFGPAWYEAAALAISSGTERFDTVIIDEAQDFPADALLTLAEQWTDGSAGEPRICLFADFSRQALYGDPEQGRAEVRKRLGGASLPLHINCRNTRRITAETELLTGSYEIRAVADAPEGPAVDRIFFAEGQARQSIDRALQALRAEGLSPEDIVILSPRRRDASALAGVNSLGGFQIIDRDERKTKSGVTFSTIHAFKGLESKAVVLVDLDPKQDPESDALLYVGMTRARTRLLLVLPEQARGELDRRTRANLSASFQREPV